MEISLKGNELLNVVTIKLFYNKKLLRDILGKYVSLVGILLSLIK